MNFLPEPPETRNPKLETAPRGEGARATLVILYPTPALS